MFHSNRFIRERTAVISHVHEVLFCLSFSPGGCLPRKIGNVNFLPRVYVLVRTSSWRHNNAN